MEKIRGHVKWFDTVKGFGFLVADDNSGDVLLHANVLRNFGRSSVTEGTIIEFELQETEKGRQVSIIHEISNPVFCQNEEKQKDSKVEDFCGKDVKPARVKWFDKSKGYGFANIFNSTEDVFLHMEVLKNNGFADLQPGEAIAIQIVEGERGKMAKAIFSWDDEMFLKDE